MWTIARRLIMCNTPRYTTQGLQCRKLRNSTLQPTNSNGLFFRGPLVESLRGEASDRLTVAKIPAMALLDGFQGVLYTGKSFLAPGKPGGWWFISPWSCLGEELEESISTLNTKSAYIGYPNRLLVQKLAKLATGTSKLTAFDVLGRSHIRYGSS
jgi:hypothetical protein